MDRLTLSEVLEKLARLDEVELIELLKLNSETLVRLCADLIEDNLEELERAVQEYE